MVKCETLLHLLNSATCNSENFTRKALIYCDEDHELNFSYSELFDAADKVCEVLCSIGVENKVVGVAISTSYHTIPSIILGIIKANAIFMCLDTNLMNCACKDLLSSGHAECIVTDLDKFFQYESWELKKKSTLLKSLTPISFLKKQFENVQPKCAYPEKYKIAYVVHTSGSTGSPKVVRVPHSCIIPNIVDLRERMNIQSSDTIFASSPFTFDPSVVDLFLAISSGAKLLMVKPALKAIPLRLARIIHQKNVSVMQATPSLFLQFSPELSCQYLCGPSSQLRIIILGGESFPSIKILQSYCHPLNTTQFYNIYGVTEVSCWSTISLIDVRNKLCEAESEFLVDLGQPMKDTQIRVTNKSNEEITKGEGYLAIGGNRRCFIDDETPDSLTAPFFRPTGDLVEILDGSLFYKGRIDNIVKRMGQRLSLDYVEQIAVGSGLVFNCCAFMSAKMLMLACVFQPGLDSLSSERLNNHFKNVAKSCEVPDRIIAFDCLPVSKHGKVDRKQLLQMMGTNKKCNKPSFENWSCFMQSVWLEATCAKECEKPKADANFILSGGNSMSAMKLFHEIQDYLGRDLPRLLDVLLNYTWKDLCEYVQQELASPSKKTVEIYQRNMATSSSQSAIILTKSNLRLAWKFDTKKCVDASPLAVDRNGKVTIYIGSHSHLVSAIDLSNGAEIWTRELADRIESSAASNSSGEKIFVGCYDGCLYCLNANDGHILWKFQTGNTIKCTPLCTEDAVICGSHDQHLYCLGVESGELRWRTRFSEASLFGSPSYNVYTRQILAASLDGSVAALSITSGQQLWRIQLAKPVFSSPLWIDESRCLVACVGGVLYCYSASQLVWKFATGAPIFSTPCITSDLIILIGSHDHFLYCLEANSGRQLWRLDFQNPLYSSPFAVSNAVVCCSTKGLLRVVDIRTGITCSEVQLNGEVFSSPIFLKEKIIIGCRDDFVYCFHAEAC